MPAAMPNAPLPSEFLADLDRTVEAYLTHIDPIRQSGFSGGPTRWRQEREPILQAVDRPGTLLDVGCANGHLLESLVTWGREVGLAIEPYGVDYSPNLIELAQRRLPHRADRFFAGNAWEWMPPRRFDYVYSLYDNVPEAFLGEYVQRLLTRYVVTGGTVIVGAYGSRTKNQPAFDVAAYLEDAGFPVAGTANVGNVPEARFAWLAADARCEQIRPVETLMGGRERRLIEIVEHDPQWPTVFQEHTRRIAQALGDTALRIEHIGSTSVPGLAAKPIIDILVVVRDSANEESYVPALEALGYQLRVREPDFHEHRMLRPPNREVHIHMLSVGSPEIGRYLTFRNRLRSDTEDRRLYEQTKRELARREWADVNDYADAKTDVIEAIIGRGVSES